MGKQLQHTSRILNTLLSMTDVRLLSSLIALSPTAGVSPPLLQRMGKVPFHFVTKVNGR